MKPTLITPSTAAVVALADLKDHLRVDSGEEDALILNLEKAAVAHLDGYHGILGRCILHQIWGVQVSRAGTYRLPLPDVHSVTATGAGGEDVEIALCHDTLGAQVTVAAAAQIQMTIAMPSGLLEAVRVAIKLLVGHWYLNREAVDEARMATTPLSFDAVIGPLRWTRI